MSWEQSSFSFEQRQPPTPTRTPTSPSYADFFNTPKPDSGFYDPQAAWTTPNPNSGSPLLAKTPRNLSFGSNAVPSLRQTSASSPMTAQAMGRSSNLNALGANFAANAQQLLSTPDFSSLHVDQSEAFSDGSREQQAQAQAAATAAASTATSGLSLDTSSSVRSAKTMQTPPPTTTSATKRQGQQTQNAGFDLQTPTKQSGVGGGRPLSVPLFPKDNLAQLQQGPEMAAAETMGQVDESPAPFSALDFSPDVFGGYNFPATAPAYPQHKLFWEPERQGDGANVDFADIPNPFGTPRQSGLNIFPTTDPSHATPSSSQLMLDFGGEGVDSSSFMRSSFISQSDGPSASIGPLDKPISHAHSGGVDPSLLFSSPSKQPELPSQALKASVNNAVVGPRILDEESLQPYAYQVQEAKRDKAFAGISKAKQKRRKPSVDSPAVKAALEALREDGENGRPPSLPPLKRSMTDSFIARGISAGTNSSGRVEAKSNLPNAGGGRSSPLKKIRESRGKPSQSHRQHRTSVALTIDEHGRARAETRIVGSPSGDGDEDAMEVDSGRGRSDSGSRSDSAPEDDEDDEDNANEYDATSDDNRDMLVMSFSSTNGRAYASTAPNKPRFSGSGISGGGGGGSLSSMSSSHAQRASYGGASVRQLSHRIGSHSDARPRPATSAGAGARSRPPFGDLPPLNTFRESFRANSSNLGQGDASRRRVQIDSASDDAMLEDSDDDDTESDAETVVEDALDKRSRDRPGSGSNGGITASASAGAGAGDGGGGDDHDDSAQNELRKVIHARTVQQHSQHQHPRQKRVSLSSPLGRYPPSASASGNAGFVQRSSRAGGSNGGAGGLSLNTTSSPTTMSDPDLATATTSATPSSGSNGSSSTTTGGQSSLSSSSSDGTIRCTCLSSTDEGQMIQCESCRHWLHLPCAGLHPLRIPKIYLCLFCTGSTPNVRGGRVRDPATLAGAGAGGAGGRKRKPPAAATQGHQRQQQQQQQHFRHQMAAAAAESPLAGKMARFR